MMLLIRRWVRAVLVVQSLLLAANAARAAAVDDVHAGYQAYRAGDFATAAQAFQRAVNSGELRQDQLAVTLNNLGAALSKYGSYDEAIAEFLKASQLDPETTNVGRNLVYAYVQRGMSRAARGDLEQALADFGQALQIDPDSVDALRQRGLLRIEMHDLVAATVDLRHVLMLQPDDPTAKAALASLEGPAPTVDGGSETTLSMPTAPSSMEPADPAAPEDPAAPSQFAGASEVGPEQAGSKTVTVLPPGVSQQARSPDLEVLSAPLPPPLVKQPATVATVDARAEDEAAAAPTQARFEVSAAVSLRAGPGTFFERIGFLNEGEIVQTGGQEGGWYQILRQGAEEGWVHRRWLVAID